MIWFDVTKAGSQRHRSGLVRVSSRLRSELTALTGSGVAEVRWHPRRKTWVLDETGRVIDLAPSDWLLTPELFNEDDRPGMAAWLTRHGDRAAAIFHDAIPLRFPEITWPQSVARHPGYMRMLARFARVFAVSEASARELVGYWQWMGAAQLPAVTRIVLGADGHGGPRCTRPPVRSDSRAAVMVGIVEPRKNQDAVLDAIEQLAGRGIRIPVTFVGRVNPHFGRVTEKRIRQMARAGHDVVHRDGLGDGAVAELVAGARFAVQPSRAEGCGLPVLESLWAGLPVLASAIPSIVESADGGGCRLVEPENTDALAAAMEQLAGDDALIDRLTREACSRELPSWSGAARAVLDGLR